VTAEGCHYTSIEEFAMENGHVSYLVMFHGELLNFRAVAG